MCFCSAGGRGQKMGFNSTVWGDQSISGPVWGWRRHLTFPCCQGKQCRFPCGRGGRLRRTQSPCSGTEGAGVCLGSVTRCLKALCVPPTGGGCKPCPGAKGWKQLPEQAVGGRGGQCSMCSCQPSLSPRSVHGAELPALEAFLILLLLLFLLLLPGRAGGQVRRVL